MTVNDLIPYINERNRIIIAHKEDLSKPHIESYYKGSYRKTPYDLLQLEVKQIYASSGEIYLFVEEKTF